MARLAFFGLGAMGEGMATNLLQAGHTVNITVHRAREPVARLTELGATTHTTKKDAADASDVIFLCLPNADVSNAVIDEIWPALSTRHMIIDTGTLSVGAATQLAERLAEHGVEFVESPVAGGKAQAAAGELGAFVGCRDTAFEKAGALLDHFCVNIQHYGPVGRASGAKLISNYLVLGMVRLIIETFHAADALEIDWTKLYETIRRGSANSGALQRIIGGIVADGTYDGYVFSVANASKDLRYISQLANDAALPVLSDAALKLFEQADQLGFGDLTVSELLRKDLREQLTELTESKCHDLWFDKQIVPDTGFQTLSERLWEPLLSVAGAQDPRRGLMNLRILAQDEAGVQRATVAGVLLCTESPQQWLPQATILATHYRGQDRASGQLDAQEIVGPLPRQIADAVRFVVRNMRVAARKLPEREDVPQYSTAAVFEAVVNAVAHRDYSMSSRRIRLSMFKGRLEIDSPGQLPNGMTIEGMETSQATRNEVITSVFGRIPVGDVPGGSLRRFLMERRGDGVSIINTQTQEATGSLPQYEIVDRSGVVLDIPAAKLELSPAASSITVHSKGEPLAGVEVLALFPNKTWRQAVTDEAGEAALDLYTTHLPMTVYVAAPGYSGGLKREWLPSRGGLMMELEELPSGGSIIFPQAIGHLPGLHGRLNPIRDTSDRTYLYANNIAIEDGRQQPVSFRLGKPMTLTDAFGSELSVTIVDIIGRSALVEYRPIPSKAV